MGLWGAQRKRKELLGAVAQLVRVPVCHTGGRGFEPRQPRTNEDESSREASWFALVVKLVDTPS